MRDESPTGKPRLELAVFSDDQLTVHSLGDGGQLTIGREEGNDVRVDDAAVSRRHCILHLDAPLRLEDLGGANGTFVRDREVTAGAMETQSLRRISKKTIEVGPGDSFTLGSTLLVLRRVRAVSQEQDRSADVTTGGDDAMARSPAMHELYEQATRVAQAQISVLILGETGVGKEVLAQALHQRSPRSKKPFLGLNCAAISESLLEGELFGSEKGAFTGAVQSRSGLLETADGGTVFLDEIGELPLSVQVKLLRVLEERVVLRVGSRTPRKIDVRFVAATNRDLDAAVADGSFRADLYFRLNGISLTVPPLRDRVEEIHQLAQLFLVRACAQMDRTAPVRLAPETRQHLERYAWPGNVRELRNAMERAVVLCNGETVLPEHLPAKIVSGMAASRVRLRSRPVSSSEDGETAERLRGEMHSLAHRRIVEALERCAGNQTKAAKILGISRRTLVTRLRDFGIQRPRSSS